VLVVDEDDFVADSRVGQADAARIAVIRIDRAPYCAMLRKFGVGQGEQIGERFGRQASDTEMHGWCSRVDSSAVCRVGGVCELRFLRANFVLSGGALRAVADNVRGGRRRPRVYSRSP